eukprot:Pompholyxophrys_sp_v1_NODE_2_length_20472_cov_5.132586.p16 type:complete len:138 gc:universal NODE_2_length_20472_cov_5.132586:15900-15487(-)
MSWLVEIYYDYLDDIYCDVTQYKFSSKELADEFIKECEDRKDVFVYDEITKTNLFFVVPEQYTRRPVFTNLKDALNDIEKLKKRFNYEYSYEVFDAKLQELEIKQLQRQVNKLLLEVSGYPKEFKDNQLLFKNIGQV